MPANIFIFLVLPVKTKKNNFSSLPNRSSCFSSWKSKTETQKQQRFPRVFPCVLSFLETAKMYRNYMIYYCVFRTVCQQFVSTNLARLCPFHTKLDEFHLEKGIGNIYLTLCNLAPRKNKHRNVLGEKSWKLSNKWISWNWLVEN